MNKKKLAFITALFQLIMIGGCGAQGYKNPVIPGFYPDPSVCRVDSDYYLVTSTFEYFPGVPVFHSRDLIHWEKIGHCLSRSSQVDLTNCRPSGGIYAPVIRYHEGLFYMVATNTGKGNFIVYTDDSRGEWSEPIWLKQGGIDPSLCWVDGDCYMVSADQGRILLCKINSQTGEQLTDTRHIWSGTGGRFPEAPHIYQKDGWFYLLLAEGGTQYGHMVTIARSRNIDGPYQPNPSNPILTHINEATKRHPIQGTGHADLLQAHDGSWWMVCLAFRPLVPRHHLLGRETFLAPVSWDEGAWPVVNRTGTIDLDMHVKTLPQHDIKPKLELVNFSERELDLEWNYLRNPIKKNYSLKAHKGYLRLYPSVVSLDDRASPTFIGRRQIYVNGEASTSVRLCRKGGDVQAGMAVFMNNLHHYDLSLISETGRYFVALTTRLGMINHTVKKVEIPNPETELKIVSCATHYTFYCTTGDKEYIELGKLDTRYLSSETGGGFTGVYWGLFARANKESPSLWADFDWFEYRCIN